MKTSGAQKGNSNAAKPRVWSDAIRKAVTQGKSLDTLATKLVKMAQDGDMQAIKEIGDRLEGRAAQSITATVESQVTVVNRNPLSSKLSGG